MVEILFYVLVFLYFVYVGGLVPLKTSILIFLALIPLLNLKRFQFLSVSRDFLKVLFLWFFYWFHWFHSHFITPSNSINIAMAFISLSTT